MKPIEKSLMVALATLSACAPVVTDGAIPNQSTQHLIQQVSHPNTSDISVRVKIPYQYIKSDSSFKTQQSQNTTIQDLRIVLVSKSLPGYKQEVVMQPTTTDMQVNFSKFPIGEASVYLEAWGTGGYRGGGNFLGSNIVPGQQEGVVVNVLAGQKIASTVSFDLVGKGLVPTNSSTLSLVEKDAVLDVSTSYPIEGNIFVRRYEDEPLKRNFLSIMGATPDAPNRVDLDFDRVNFISVSSSARYLAGYNNNFRTREYMSVFEKDGTRILHLDYSTICDPDPNVTCAAIRSATLSPNGDYIFYSSGNQSSSAGGTQFFLYDIKNKSNIKISDFNNLIQYAPSFFRGWLDDENVLIEVGVNYGSTSVYFNYLTYNIKTKESMLIDNPEKKDIGGIVIKSTNKLAYQCKDNSICLLDLQNKVLSTVKVDSRINLNDRNKSYHLSAHPTKNIATAITTAFWRDSDSHLLIMDLDTGKVLKINLGDYYYKQYDNLNISPGLAWSPDGQKLLMVASKKGDPVGPQADPNTTEPAIRHLVIVEPFKDQANIRVIKKLHILPCARHLCRSS